MAVYGPVRHQKNIIWTEASEPYRTRSDMNYVYPILYFLSKIMQVPCQSIYYPGADPGFVVRGGGVSRRGVWGPHTVPSGSRAEPR
jgi:hypothetical protein